MMLPAAVTLVAFSALPSQQQAVTETALTEAGRREIVRTLSELEQRWIEVYASHDLSLLERILADDFVATLAGGAMRRKEEHIAAYREDFETLSAVANSDVQVHVYTREAAVVTGRYTASVRQPDGSRSVEQYRFTDTWLMRRGSWQCVATQETQLAVKALP
jgi:ketosteroid isomerase-like protein